MYNINLIYQQPNRNQVSNSEIILKARPWPNYMALALALALRAALTIFSITVIVELVQDNKLVLAM